MVVVMVVVVVGCSGGGVSCLVVTGSTSLLWGGITTSELNLFNGVLWERVWCGQERGLDAVTSVSVSHEGEHGRGTIREGEAVTEEEREMENGYNYTV